MTARGWLSDAFARWGEDEIRSAFPRKLAIVFSPPGDILSLQRSKRPGEKSRVDSFLTKNAGQRLSAMTGGNQHDVRR
jgi:hypothetical protein